MVSIGNFRGIALFLHLAIVQFAKKCYPYKRNVLAEGDKMPQMRLDKLLSHLNCGSRKEVQALIRAGRVSVDGTVQKDPAFKVDPDRSQTAVDGVRYYMLNKPMGVITASRDERHDTVLELFPDELRRAACLRWEGWTRTPRDCCSSRTTARSAMR